MAGELLTGPGQMQWGDLLIGPDPLRLRSLDGWEELPGLDDASMPYSGQHGSAPGALLAQARTVTAEVIVRVPADQVGAMVTTLNSGTRLGDAEQPLVVWLDSRGPLLVHGRVIRRRLPVDRAYRVGTIVGVALQWSCSDPRRYEATEQAVTTGLPQPESGLTFPLTFSLDWGTPAVSGTLTATNSGDAPAPVVIEFRGPVAMPSLVRLGDGVRLEYDVTLTAAETLTVDTAAGTVRLDGADRLYTATNRSIPEQAFTLEPGSTDLAYRAAPGSTDPAATVTVRWRSAHW
ncbi:phage tail family protein [Embleya sp. NBC_00888]|uniref:phage distal tail protein n=1 Tax=Embleya sp. NBC_00888 TaxID=2975960 RepID=UPI00386A7BB3|nr:phage tail family protein [Embleya sp. NBC_00888]